MKSSIRQTLKEHGSARLVFAGHEIIVKRLTNQQDEIVISGPQRTSTETINDENLENELAHIFLNLSIWEPLP